MAEGGGRIWLNGREEELGDSRKLDALLARLGFSAGEQGVAVAVNEEVIPRHLWGEWVVNPGDRVEVVRPVQGG